MSLLLLTAESDGPSAAPRRGAVRPLGKAVTDDTGIFHPLGMTFFWAMHGWKFERDRFLKNLDWLVATGNAPDYLRILGQVDWPGNEIDPAWPDFDEVFMGTSDAINQRGMKVELTMLGSPYGDPVGLARRLSGLIASRHAGSIIDVEIWNEWNQNGGDLDAMIQAAIVFGEAGIPLVALSSSILDDQIAYASSKADATMGTDHTDRGEGDGNWRMVRQGFDARLTRLVYNGGEPPGVDSSIRVLEAPLQLAMLRATSVQSGGALWCLHVGDMVQGIEDPQHGRHPNLWDVQVHDEITNRDHTLPEVMAAVRRVDGWMPEGVENWSKSAGNPNIGRQALVPDIAGWPDGGEGCNRFYAAFADDGRFCQVLDGVKGTRTFTMQLPGTYEIVGENPHTQEELTVTLSQGQTIVISGRDDGMTGYILNGVPV